MDSSSKYTETIENLILDGLGEKPRLNDMLNRVKNGKPLYNSDLNYLQKLLPSTNIVSKADQQKTIEMEESSTDGTKSKHAKENVVHTDSIDERKTRKWIAWSVMSAILLSFMIYIFYMTPKFGQPFDNLISVSLVGIFTTTVLFFTLTLVKGYKKLRQIIENTIEESTITVTNVICFIGLSIGIVINLFLLIQTGAIDSLSKVFPPLEIVKEYTGSLDAGLVSYLFNLTYNNNLIFRFFFVSIGAIVLFLLGEIRITEKKKNSDKYPGLRILLSFLLLSSAIIIIKLNGKLAEPSTVQILDPIKDNLAITAFVFSSAIYMISRVLRRNLS